MLFDQQEFEHVCNLLTDPSTASIVLAPQYSHTDTWEFSGHTLTRRTHKRSGATVVSPDGTKDRRVGLEDLPDERTTFLEYEDGSMETLVDNWREVESPKERSSQRFVGKTFNQPEFEQMCNLLKDPSTSGTLVAHTAPQYSHTDKWELSGNTRTRTHKRSRATFFSPDGTKDQQ